MRSRVGPPGQGIFSWCMHMRTLIYVLAYRTRPPCVLRCSCLPSDFQVISDHLMDSYVLQSCFLDYGKPCMLSYKSLALGYRLELGLKVFSILTLQTIHGPVLLALRPGPWVGAEGLNLTCWAKCGCKMH